MVRRVLIAGLLLLGTLETSAAGPRSDAAALDALTTALETEKRALGYAADELERATFRMSRAESAVGEAHSRLLQLAKDGGDRAAVQDAEEAIAEAESRLRQQQERRRALSTRVGDRLRQIAVLREEIARYRTAQRGVDPVSGRWEVSINPGSQKGIYRLVLDGTIVSGDYTLSGGFRGSLRGTYVGDKVTLQRIDSERGLDATFYGKVVTSPKKIIGTWEATAIAPAIGPTAGTWAALPAPDRNDEDGERP